MIDRLFPNLQVEMGGGEYLFGTSFGIMRSENPTYPSSMFVLSPQLDDSCNDGTTIVGSGYSINISTSCSCAASYSSTDLVTAGGGGGGGATAAGVFNLEVEEAALLA
jgi:hypothetical protein